MRKPDRRSVKTYIAVRSAVCQILSSAQPYRFNIKIIARKAHVDTSTVRRLCASPWKLLDLLDNEIKEEFARRREIQKEIGKDSRTADFFMLSRLQFITTVNILQQC